MFIINRAQAPLGEAVNPEEPKDIIEADAGEPAELRIPWYQPSEFEARLVHGRLASILAEDPSINEPMYHVIPMIAAARRLTILIAREKAGKSTFIAYCAACFSAGKSILGSPAFRPGRVLWVGLEEPVGDAVSRFLRIGATLSNVNVIDRLQGSTAVAQIVEEMKAFRPALVVIDSLSVLARTRGLSEKSEEGWTEMMTALRHAAQDIGAAVVVLHHARKSDGEYRGSTAIGAAADQLVTMERDKEEMIRRFTSMGRWQIPDFSTRFDMESGTFTLMDQNTEPWVGDDDSASRMLQQLHEHPGTKKTALCEMIGGNAARMRALVDSLLASGQIEKRPDGGLAVAGTGQGPAAVAVKVRAA
jgi:hypothetical protein